MDRYTIFTPPPPSSSPLPRRGSILPTHMWPTSFARKEIQNYSPEEAVHTFSAIANTFTAHPARTKNKELGEEH